MSAETQSTSAQNKHSWNEVWALIGVDGDEMLSCTQTQLAYEAYDVEKPPSRAVEDNDLTEVHRQGVDITGGTMQIQAGYRLIGEPETPEGDDE